MGGDTGFYHGSGKEAGDAMRYALVIVQKPEADRSKPDWEKSRDYQWRLFLHSDGVPIDLRHAEGRFRLNEGVWLLPLASDLPILSRLILWAAECRRPYRVLLLDKEPEWLGTTAPTA